jgi:hypothetical protein
VGGAQGSAPALGDAPPRPRQAGAPKPAARAHGPASRNSGLSITELAAEAKHYDDQSAYGLELEALRELRQRAKPDADLEIALALTEARLGHHEDALKRLNGPLVVAAEHDSMPVIRRTDYQQERDRQWVNGAFDGWLWYIVRARAELAATLGRWHEARVAAEAAVQARPLAGKEWLILAVCAGHDGDMETSRQAAQTAFDLDPTLPEASYITGLYAWRDSRRAEAQDRFRTAVSLDSTYRAAATALVRCQLPFGRPDSLPAALLTGPREAGLITSATGPKLEEFVQMDKPAVITRSVTAALPDSLRRGLEHVQMTLPILVDRSGRIVLHELPWFEPARIPATSVAALLEALPLWRFSPALRHGEPQPVWTAIPFSLQAGN